MKNPLPQQVYIKRTTEKSYGIRGDYFRDQTAIIHSMPFRRLKHKTQVFFSPENDHVCTRIEHVLHVATIAATICKGLIMHGWELEPDMAYAMGLGHDLGHAPFGHAGEKALDEKLKKNKKGSFIHEINSYRIIEHLSNYGKGLNLTYAVKDGIICHNGENFEAQLKPAGKENILDNIKDRTCIPSSYEGCIVRFSDKIAYLGRDIEDAIIARFIKRNDIPGNISGELGDNNGDIINTFIMDLINFSKDKDFIGFSPEKQKLIEELREFNYKNIYNNSKMVVYQGYCVKIINDLFDYLSAKYHHFGNDYKKYEEGEINLVREFGNYISKMETVYIKRKENYSEQIIADYIAGMTDDYALDCMKQISIPEPIRFRK